MASKYLHVFIMLPILLALIGASASTSFLAQPFGTGHALEASPSDMVTLIATGQLPSVASNAATTTVSDEAHDSEGDHMLGVMLEYEDRLKEAAHLAEESYHGVLEKEESLQHEFEPTMAGLQESIRGAADQAAKAEAMAMSERLKGVHYKQAAALDRSATFWEDRLMAEKELSRQAAAKQQLEDSTQLSLAASTGKRASDLLAVRTEEKMRLDDWLRNFTTKLMDEGAR